MDNNRINISEIKCPGCGSTLKMPPGGSRMVKCEYCGGEYAVNWNQGTGTLRQAPNWTPALPPQQTAAQKQKEEDAIVLRIVIGILVFIVAGTFLFINGRRKAREKEIELSEQAEAIESYTGQAVGHGQENTDETVGSAEFSGLLGDLIQAAFGKDANNVTAQELSRIKWVADRSDFDYHYIGYSFDDPLEDPDAEIEWLAYPDEIGVRYEYGYDGLCALKGLKKLETRKSLSDCDLRGLKLESLSANIYSLEDAAAAVDDPSLLRELGIKNGIESLEGMELFPNVETLSVYASSLSDVNVVTAMPNLKSLTLENADKLNDFAVFASIENLEELVIESENIKALNFVGRIPHLKSLGISDGELLDLDGLEALESLEKLSVTDCRELRNMTAVEGLTGLKELTLEKPYDCEEPSLAALTELEKLTLKSFSSCGFLQNMTNLKKLALHSCDVPENLDLSGLDSLTELTCTTFYQDRPLKFVNGLSSLESVNLRGMTTYDDISGIFMLPHIKKIDISGIECEIAFDKITENASLETLLMSGIKLYENVKVSGGGGIVYVDWDDVFLAEHTDFMTKFPNLKKLDIADNEIKDLEFAGKLTRLEEIDFSDNYISEMRPLAAVPTLKWVNCKGNPVGNLRVLDESVIIING